MQTFKERREQRKTDLMMKIKEFNAFEWKGIMYRANAWEAVCCFVHSADFVHSTFYDDDFEAYLQKTYKVLKFP